MAEPDTKPPAGRIAIAVGGLNPKSLADVRATDLAAVCALVPTDKADDITRALAQGAAGAVKGHPPAAVRRIVVGVGVADLTHLLAAVA